MEADVPGYRAGSKSGIREEPLNIKDLPKMKCERCGACCGPSYANKKEYERIKQYMKEHGIRPVKHDSLKCPLYQNNACAVYPVRPVLCRLFGHSERLPCKQGNNVNVPDRKVRKLLKDNIDDDQPLFNLLFERDFRGPEEKVEKEED
jgi:hypothetical protein